MPSVYVNFPDVFDLNLRGKIGLAILKEIDLRFNEIEEKFVESIYIKSPKNNILSFNFLESLISKLNHYFLFSDKLEITLELDIQRINIKNLEGICKTKVNRLSCRTSSLFYNNFSSNKLYNRFFKNIDLISNFYKNYSIDLIFGIPNLSNESLEKFLKKLNKNVISHITLEEYNCKPNNLSCKEKYLNKNYIVDQYNFCCEKLFEYGFEQYEYLNFSRNGKYSKQNLNYWNRKPYLGFGPSACSFFKELRSVNLSDTRDYLLEINKFQKPLYIEYLSQKDIYNETIMTGLSISKGLSLLVIRKNFKSFDPYFQGKVKKHLGLGNLYLEKNSIKVNQEHKYFTDEIAADFFKN